MRKKMRKIVTSLLTLAMVLGCMTIYNVPANAEGETTAYLTFADEAWAAQYWMDGNDYAPVVVNTTEVTGYGQYTTSLDLTGVEAGFASGIAFLDVEISNGESAYPNSFMTIDSLKINGEEVVLGKTYTSSDDDIATRSNLYNEWVSTVDKGRTVDGDATDVSAIIFDKTLYPEVKTIEVTFTLGDGVAFGAETEVVAAELPEEGTTSYITMADNSWAFQYWNDGNDYSPVVVNPVAVTGYGQYTTSIDFTSVDGGVCPDIAFMDVEIQDGELYFPNCYMQIDSVKINGEEATIGNSYTSSDDGLATRTNLFNSWVETVEEGRTDGLELADVTPTPIDGVAYTNIETVEVTFTLIAGEAGEVAEEVEYVMPVEFKAFMMFSDVSGAWESYEAGTTGDTVVYGDGTYTVSLKASDIEATGQATEGQVFLVDIENLGEAMFHLGTLRENEDETLTDSDATVSVEVYVDGELVNSKDKNILSGDIEGNGKFRIELYNAWGTGTADSPVVMPELLTPADEIKVVFTLVGTGLNTAEEAVVEEVTVVEEPVEEVVESGMDTVVIIIIIVLAAVVVGGAIVIIKKKKK